MSPPETDCWVVTNGAAGNVRQADALAAALRRSTRAISLNPSAPWSWLAPRLTLAADHALDLHERAALRAPWPPLVIGCGRDAALFTRLLRHRSNGRCRTIQILDPRMSTRHWDLVIAPQHDGLTGSNVLCPLGSLNPVDEAWLALARDRFRQFAALPAPRLGVLLGGPRRGVNMDTAFFRSLRQCIQARLQRDGGSMLLATSRRTPPGLARSMVDALAPLSGIAWCGPADGINPFAGILAWADRLLVSPDSVNMLSEACAVGCAVHTLTPSTLPPRLARFHSALRERGLLHAADAAAPARQPPLRETPRIAAAVARRLQLNP